jgi:hypothetical protein
MAGLGTLIAVIAAAGQVGTGARIDPTADRVLRRMCRYLQSQRQFHIAATEEMDAVRVSGQKVRFSNYRDVTIRRPNRIYSEVAGDTLNRHFWYDGKSMTMLDTKRNLYATAPAAPTIDATLDRLARDYRLYVPLADLVFSDPYQELTEHVQTGAYLGVHSVDRYRAHHLLFTQEHVDWQIWIDAGARPVPRKVVITHKDQPGQPEYQATLYDWSVGPPAPEGMFHFRPPKGATRIEIVPVGKQPHDVRKVDESGKGGPKPSP